MQLTKAIPQAAPFKCTLYGDFGTGKTTFAMMMAEGLAARRKGRIAYFDTEFGTKYLAAAAPARAVHPEAFDFDRVVTRSLAEITEGVKALDPKVHTVIVVDSITHCWEAAREAWENANPGRDIALRDWGPIKRPYKALIKFLMDSSQDVIVVGRQKTIFEENEAGKLTNAGVGLRADADTQFEPDFCFQMYSVGKRGDETKPALFVEKDRSSILHGRTFPDPRFATIAPILAVLGTEALKMDDDEDERKSKDSALLHEGEEKGKAKEEKSAGILADFQGKILASTTLEALAAVAGELKKLKRYMVEDHAGALRVLYEERRRRLVDATVPEGV
jgi:hypothetical protein